MRVGFSTSKHWLSRLIRKVLRSPASHTYVVFDGLWDEPWILEATSSGVFSKGAVRTLPYEAVASKRRIVSEHKLLEAGVINSRAGLVAVGELLGKDYDKWGAVGLGFCVLGRRLGREWKNHLDNPDKYYCTELTMAFIQGSLVPGFQDYSPMTESHEVLRQLILDSSRFQEVATPEYRSWWRRWRSRKAT